ncbi:MAG: hypothetical protein AAFZ99_06645 [Pseudomonadota bacterium]
MTTIAYDRRSIMLEAWDRTREFMTRNPFGRRTSAFARYLSEAWVNEKSRLYNARRAEALANMSEREIQVQLDRAANYKSRSDDYPVPLLYQVLKAKRAEVENAVKRDLIKAVPACTVTFTKADGSRRVMRVEARKVADHVKGDNATRSGRIASHTRAFRHPNLLPVWDTEARAIKSVNLSTISRIETASETHSF